MIDSTILLVIDFAVFAATVGSFAVDGAPAVATAADLQPNILAERLLHDVVLSKGIVIGPPLVGA